MLFEATRRAVMCYSSNRKLLLTGWGVSGPSRVLAGRGAGAVRASGWERMSRRRAQAQLDMRGHRVGLQGEAGQDGGGALEGPRVPCCGVRTRFGRRQAHVVLEGQAVTGGRKARGNVASRVLTAAVTVSCRVLEPAVCRAEPACAGQDGILDPRAQNCGRQGAIKSAFRNMSLSRAFCVYFFGGRGQMFETLGKPTGE